MSKPWLCFRCNFPLGLPFESETPQCPKCGARPPAVTRMQYVHFLVPGGGPIVAMEGQQCRVACDPAIMSFRNGMSVSHQVDAVTCPRCRAAVADFAKMLAAFEEENPR